MITMTEEQRFLFDLNGFLVIENVLDLETCERLIPMAADRFC
jgi:hypothetical protein